MSKTEKCPLPDEVIQKTRDWAFGFNFGEWFPRSEIINYMKSEFGYKPNTAATYACFFIKRGIRNSDFETRLNGRQWRWIVHPYTGPAPTE